MTNLHTFRLGKKIKTHNIWVKKNPTYKNFFIKDIYIFRFIKIFFIMYNIPVFSRTLKIQVMMIYLDRQKNNIKNKIMKIKKNLMIRLLKKNKDVYSIIVVKDKGTPLSNLDSLGQISKMDNTNYLVYLNIKKFTEYLYKGVFISESFGKILGIDPAIIKK